MAKTSEFLLTLRVYKRVHLAMLGPKLLPRHMLFCVLVLASPLPLDPDKWSVALP